MCVREGGGGTRVVFLARPSDPRGTFSGVSLCVQEIVCAAWWRLGHLVLWVVQGSFPFCFGDSQTPHFQTARREGATAQPKQVCVRRYIVLQAVNRRFVKQPVLSASTRLANDVGEGRATGGSGEGGEGRAAAANLAVKWGRGSKRAPSLSRPWAMKSCKRI